MPLFWLLLGLSALLCFVSILGLGNRRNKLPPGPFRWPIVGNLPHIALINWQRVWFAIDHYAKKYGDVIGLYFGPRFVVVLSNPKIVHEVMRLEEWNGRPRDNFAKIKAEGKVLGVILTEGDLWKETRRFTVRHLRDFGFGKASMEASIMQEVMKVCRNLTEEVASSPDRDGAVVTFDKKFGPAVLSTLWGMISGYHCEIDDPAILELQQIVQNTLRRRPIGAGLFWSFQFLRHLFPKISGFAYQLEGFNRLKQHMRGVIAEHKRTRVPGEPRDFIDAYLDEKESDPNNPYFFDEQLVVTCMDFFVAGSDTTTTSLRFCLLYLILYPDVQRKIQKEIDLLVGRNRAVDLSDREKLVYMEATLLETSRYASVAPIVTPHTITKHIEYNGFQIPTRSVVFINTWGIHRNEAHWGDPETFRPERFVNSDGTLISNDEWLLPFGSGKRRCPGEHMAKTSIFLMIANLLQRFTFSVVPGTEPPSEVPIIGLNLAPQPYTAWAKPR